MIVLPSALIEYRNKTITKIFCGSAKSGCYFLALSIFFAGMVRDSLYEFFVPSGG